MAYGYGPDFRSKPWLDAAESFLPKDQNNYTNQQRMLPSQSLMRQFWAGDVQFEINEPFFYGALESLTNSVLPIKSVHDKFDIQLAPGMTYETLGSDLSTLHFLQLLVRLAGARHVLEIGTYIGVSAMFLAEAVGENGRVVTIEKGPEFAGIARNNFRWNAVGERIELIQSHVANCLGPAENRSKLLFTPLQQHECWPFDVLFLDGAKEGYGAMLDYLLVLLRPGGLMVVDDVFCQGDTLNPEPTTDKGRGVRDLLDQVAKLKDHSPVILPYGDGLLLLRKPT